MHSRFNGAFTGLTTFALAAGLLAIAPVSRAQGVEYVKICSLFGAGYYYLPGTDICHNPTTGDARVVTEGGVLASRLPYPEGNWVTKNVQPECSPGRAVKVGTFKSTDFTPNAFERKQTGPVPLALTSGEFVSKVIMSGGFYDPRAIGSHGVNGMDGLCVRSVDPSVIEAGVNPPFGNGGRPIGCVANSRIINMPAAYSISATSAHPSVDILSSDSGDPLGTVPYGKALVVTTDLDRSSSLLTYQDGGVSKPLAGDLTVWLCVGK